MSTNTIGSRIVLEGEKEYRQALQNINTEQKNLRSEMKLCSSEFEGQQNSLDALTKKHEILGRQIESQNKKIQLYTQQLEESQKAHEVAGNKIDSLQEQLQAANKEMDAMKASSKTSAEALEEQQKKIDSLNQQLEGASKEYNKTEQATVKWQTQINNASADLNSMNSDLQNTEKYMEEARKSTNGCASSIDEYGKRTKEAAEQTSVFGDVLKANLVSDAIKKGIKVIAEGIKEIAEAATSTGSSFEASMSQVAATMGMTVDEINSGSDAYKLLSEAAKECGKNTVFSASEAGEALNYLALAGYDAEKSAKTLPKVLDLAAAGGLDLARASDLVTDSMAALNLETNQLDGYIDKMARTSQKSNTSVAQLGEATLVCAGTVSMARQSLETMNTELGVLANNGIKGAEGGTHLRNIILSLSAPTDTAADALSNLELKINDSNGSMRDLNDIMMDLDKKLSSMSSSQKTQIISQIFNKTDIAAVNALLKGTGTEYDNLNKEIKNCSGAAADMAATLNNNLKGKVTILKSALEGLGISAYEIFDDDMKGAVDSATDAVGRLQNSIDNGDLGVSLNKMSDALGDFVERAVDAGEDALPVLIDGMTWLLDNSGLVTSGIVGITTATIYHSTVAPMIVGVAEAWNKYKAANEAAAVAQGTLNVAMKANPAGLLVTAIVGLTAAVATFALTTANAESEADKLVQKSREAVDTLAQETQSRKESTAANEAEMNTVRNLTQELLKLDNKEKLSTEEKSRMLLVVDELNQAMPELNLSIDEQTGHLDENSKGWEKDAEAMMAAMELQFKQEELTEIAKERYEAEKKLTEIQATRAELEEDLGEAIDKYNAWGTVLDDTSESAFQVERNMRNLSQAVEEQKGLEEELNAQMKSLDEEYTALYDSMSGVNEKAFEGCEMMVEYGDKMLTVQVDSEETRNAIESLAEEYANAKEAATESIESQVGLFEELSTASDLSIGQMSQNLQSQTDAFTQYKDDILRCSELVEQGILDEGLLGSIQALGMDGAGYMHELATASDEDIGKVVESFEEMQEAKDHLASAIADINTEYTDRMDELLGIQTEKMDLYKNTAEESNEEVGEIMKAGSEETVNTATDTMDSFNDEIKKGTVVVTDSMEKLCDSVILETSTKMNIVEGKSLVFQEIGRTLPAGLAQGINDGTSEVEAAISNLVDKMIAKAIAKIKEAKRSIDKALGDALR